MATKTGISLKILVDRKSQRVVFAEAGKDFVDFLFHISYLPVGTVMKLLSDHGVGPVSGCLSNIYKSIEKFSKTMMLALRQKDDMLNPMCVTFTKSDLHTLPKIQTSTSSTFHACNSENVNRHSILIATNGIFEKCTVCNNNSCVVRGVSEPTKGFSSEKKGYVKGGFTYMVMDDLTVMPASGLSGNDILNGFDIKNVGILEAREVHLGNENALKLLKASIQSKTLLTDVFLCGKDSKDSK